MLKKTTPHIQKIRFNITSLLQGDIFELKKVIVELILIVRVFQFINQDLF